MPGNPVRSHRIAQVLLATLEETGLTPRTTIILTSSFGFPLGEHLVVGLERAVVYGELTHVPLLIMTPQQQLVGLRSQGLHAVDCVGNLFERPATSSHCTGMSLPSNSWPFVVCRALAGSTMIRSPAWLLVQNKELAQLFVKPDDRWEVNDVASRCPEILSGLTELLKTLDASVPPVPFDPQLIEPIE